MYIVAGLGNPDKKYNGTRHNAGFDAIDRIFEHESWKNQFQAICCKSKVGSQELFVCKPQTYMNLSGESLQKAAAFYKVPPERIIVFVDDVQLSLGQIRIRPKGSHGGQNGLRNIIQHLGDRFIRVRIGVGPCPVGWDLAGFVLSKFVPEEKKIYSQILDKMPDLLATMLSQGVEQAMNRFNGVDGTV
jgi:peptidyl-tRNA hydrolase, PTH1 family